MTKVIPIEIWPCDQYGYDIDSEGHTCPYREDLFGDHTTLCNCDEAETKNCADDI